MEDDILTSQFPCSAQTDFCALLPSVITFVFVLAFPTLVEFFMHSYIMSRNDFLQAVGGLFLIL